MGSTNKFFGDFDNGLGLDLWYEVNPFTATPNRIPRWSFDSRKVAKHKITNNLVSTSMFRQKDGTPMSEFIISSQVYNDDEYVNDTSLIKTIEYLQKWKSTYVDYADFAYLKNLGVYPMNRLMIARRFPNPVGNNLYAVDQNPMATMITWMPDDNDFFKVTFGEIWTENKEGSLEAVLNSIGDEFSPRTDPTKAGFGSMIYGGGKFASLPGATEALQIKILKRLGYLDYDANNPPSGNPNLIKESSQRTTIDKHNPGSGLTCQMSVDFVVEYEQKYINGIDPSLVYMDIIQKALIFGTSESTFMYNLGSGKLGTFVEKLVRGDLSSIIITFSDFLDSLKVVLDTVLQAFVDVVTTDIPVLGEIFVRGDTTKLNDLSPTTKSVLGHVLSKYRLRLFSTLQALTGAPSGVWHVSIGNPRKPFLSTGDMITTSVTIAFGNVLAYNDLPSSLKISFTLTSARNLGGQEIMDRFNTGQGRTYLKRRRSYFEIPLGESQRDETDEQVDNRDYENRKKKFDEGPVKTVNNNPTNYPGPNAAKPIEIAAVTTDEKAIKKAQSEPTNTISDPNQNNPQTG